MVMDKISERFTGFKLENKNVVYWIIIILIQIYYLDQYSVSTLLLQNWYW